MRKTLESAALLLLLFTWAVTARAIVGRNPLPARIPTHFNAAGQPDGWGTPGMLWLLPVVAAIIYMLMTLVSRYPGAFNFPMRTAPAARRQLEGLALNLIGWLKAEVIGLFAWIQYETVQLARRGQGTLSTLFLPAVMVVVFGTIAWHIAAMRRVARAG
jgi:uncharacterized membrane protein